MDARKLCDMIARLRESGRRLTLPLGLGYGTVFWDNGRFVVDHGFCEMQFQEPIAMDDTYLYLGMGMDRTCIDCRAISERKVNLE